MTVPLDVRAETLPVISRMPNLPWRAVRGNDDHAYRFLVTNKTVAPVGSIPITVEAPGGEYVNFEPFTVTLPRTLAKHPPTPDRSDFLVERPLWPTRVIRLPPGETAISGVVRSSGGVHSVSGLRVFICDDRDSLPSDPYSYTNAAGEFLFRLPADFRSPGQRFKGAVSGGVIQSTVSLKLDLRASPTYAASVTPTAPTIPFTVDLGRITTLQITIP